MGAWGTGILDDDTAMDTLDELREMADPRPFMREAFNTVLAADYVDYDAGHAALVSAAIIALATKARPLPGIENVGDDEETAANWLDGLSQLDFSLLMAPASEACLKVADGPSELKELWTEDESDGSVWQDQGRELAKALSPGN
jgi:hypothetical protein